MADLQQTVGLVIRRARQERELTLKELAERAVLSVVYLGEIERGKKYPSSLVLERLASALDLEVSDLLEQVALELRGPVEARLPRVIGFSRAASPTPTVPRAEAVLAWPEQAVLPATGHGMRTLLVGSAVA